MHFQIYVPHTVSATQPGVHPLEAAGLSDLVGDSRAIGVDVGPDQDKGVCYGWSRDGFPQLGVRPKEQTWRPAVPHAGMAGSRYWVGLWNDDPPRPSDLQRPYACRGTWFPLGDGREWLLPQAKELPADVRLADDGTWRFQVQRRFHDFGLQSLRWLSHFGRGEKAFAFADGIEFVVQALCVNYRLVPEVIADLGLLTTDNVGLAMLSIVEGLAESLTPEGQT